MLSRTKPSNLTLWLSVLVITIVTGFLHREVLFQRAIYHMDDAADNYYPARVAFRRALHEGTLPSWEPGAMSGWPLLADPYYGYFYPPNVVFYLGPRAGEPPSGDAGGVPSGLGYSAALHMWIAGLGMLWLLRRRTSWAAALFGALAFALSSFLVVRIRHIIFVQAMAWLPWLLWAVEHHLQTQKKRSLAAAAAFAGLLLLAGAHSLLHFLLMPVVVYVGGRIVSFALARPAGQRLGYAAKTFVWVGLAGLCGCLIGAIALLPTLVQMPLTGRALGTDYYFASTYAWPETKYWQTLLMPDMVGRGEWRGEPWVGKWNHWEIAGYYQGVVSVLLAIPGGIIGFWRRRTLATGDVLAAGDDSGSGLAKEPTFSVELPLLLLLSFAAMSIALGDHGALHPWLFRYFPLYAALRCPSRALSILVLTMPLLSAIGADVLLGGSRGKKWWLLGLGVALALAAWFIGIRHQAELFRQAMLAPLSKQLGLLAKAHASLYIACFAGVALLRIIGQAAGPLSLLLLAALTVSDQTRIDRGYLHPQPIDYAYGTERFSAVNWLLQNQPPVASPDPSSPPFFDRFVSDPRGPFRLLALGETVGRPSAAGYGSIQLWRYSHLLYILNHGQPYPHRRLKEDLAAAMLWRLDSPLVDMLNVRYLIGSSPPSPKWVERFRPPLGQPPPARYEPYWDPLLAVFENTQVMPRAFVAYQARLASTQDEEAQLVARPDFDPHREIILGRPSGKDAKTQPVPSIENQNRAHSVAQIVSQKRHQVTIDATVSAPGVLVLADAYHPDWSVTVDGKPDKLWPVNLALRGVLLSPGSHRIEMQYRDRGLRLGMLLSLIGLLAALWLYRYGARKDREKVHV
ncbi:MAG TPA: YfhO family protein [Pseudomonadota bacterium]|nr:YfhO family protein [Pseudomonadota bacterium]HNI59998.1 YfhO family protein [Pseudomonadota bacterium]